MFHKRRAEAESEIAMKMKIPFFNIDITKSAVPPNKLVRSFMFPWHHKGGLSPDSDFNNYLKAYQGWVYTASSKNATAVASTPIKLYAGKPNRDKIKSNLTKPITKEKDAAIRSNASLSSLPQVRKAVEIVEVVDHPMLDLFLNVNSFMNQFSLFEITDLYQELCGNAYWYILKDNLGIPRELWPIPPNLLKVVPDKVEFIKGYVLTRGFQKELFDEKDIVHFKMPSPTSVYYGQGPLAAVTSSYNISQNINRYENFVFKNMGRLEGAFETDNELSQYEFERLKKEISQTFRGTDNAGKSPLLEKGVKYKAYGATPRDLSFLNGRSKVKEEIMNAYGQSLGLWDKDSTRANAMVANETFMRDAIRPRLIRTEEKINEKLTPQFDDSLFVAFDDPVPQDKAFRLKQIESNLKSGYSSINMERLSDNQDPVDWGDEPILNNNMSSLSDRPDNSGSQDGSDDMPPEDMSQFLNLKTGIQDFTEDLCSMIIERLRGEN